MLRQLNAVSSSQKAKSFGGSMQRSSIASTQPGTPVTDAAAVDADWNVTLQIVKSFRALYVYIYIYNHVYIYIYVYWVCVCIYMCDFVIAYWLCSSFPNLPIRCYHVTGRGKFRKFRKGRVAQVSAAGLKGHRRWQ